MAKKTTTPKKTSPANPKELTGAEMWLLMKKISEIDNKDSEIPFKLKYALGRIHNAWQTNFEFIEKRNQELIMKYGEPLGDGNISIQPGTPKFNQYQYEWGIVLADSFSTNINYNPLTSEQVLMLPELTLKTLLSLYPVIDTSYFEIKGTDSLETTFVEVNHILNGVSSIESIDLSGNPELLKKVVLVRQEIFSVTREVNKILQDYYNEVGKPVENQPDKLEVEDDMKSEVEKFQDQVLNQNLYKFDYVPLTEEDLEFLEGASIKGISGLFAITK